MRVAGLVAASLLITAVTGVQAHAHLQEVTPADGSTISAAPAQISLRFSQNARLTALSIQKDGGDVQKLAPLPHESQSRIAVPLPTLGPGRYLVSWRALSTDGHVVSGQIHFTLAQ